MWIHWLIVGLGLAGAIIMYLASQVDGRASHGLFDDEESLFDKEDKFRQCEDPIDDHYGRPGARMTYYNEVYGADRLDGTHGNGIDP